MKKTILLSLTLFSLCLLNGCNNETIDPVVEKEYSLFSYLNEYKDSEDYVLNIVGEGSSPMSSTTYNKTISYSKNVIKFEENFGTYKIVTGYINKDKKVYTFKQNDGTYVLDNEISGNTNCYDMVFSLSKLKLDTYLAYENNNYNFELSVDSSGNPVKYIDYYNVYVLASMLKIGTQLDYVAGAKLSFNKDKEALYFELISYLANDGGQEFIFSYNVSFSFINNTSDVSEALSNSTFNKTPLNEKFQTIKTLCSYGYGIKNYSIKGSDGNGNSLTFSGNVYINDRYCVFDYSTDAYQAIQGFLNYEDAVYAIQPSGTSVSISKIISKKEIMDFNKQNNSSYTSLDFARLMFYQMFNIIPIETTAVYQNENYIQYDSTLDLFYASDYFDLLGFSNNVDETLYFTMLNPQIRPLSYTLTYKEYGDPNTTEDDLINVGYIGYKEKSGGNGISNEGNYRLFSYSNFRMKDDLMEFIFEYTLPNM